MAQQSVLWAGEAPSPQQVQQGSHVCIFRSPSSLQLSHLWQGCRTAKAWRAPCSLWECKECPPEQLLLQNQQLVPSAPLGSLCSPQVMVLGSGASPNSAPLKHCHPQFVVQRSFQGGEILRASHKHLGMGIPQSITQQTSGGAAKACEAEGDRKRWVWNALLTV